MQAQQQTEGKKILQTRLESLQDYYPYRKCQFKTQTTQGSLLQSET